MCVYPFLHKHISVPLYVLYNHVSISVVSGMTASTFLEAFQILLNLASNLQQLSIILFRMYYLIAKILVKILKDYFRKKIILLFLWRKNHSNDLILLSFLSLHLFFLSVDEKHFALPSYNFGVFHPFTI